MSLQQQIADDLKSAMKARDRERMGALRMAIAALKNKAVDEGLGPQGELSDDLTRTVIAAEAKKRREAAKGFRDGGREESAAAEEYEEGVLNAYLPAQMSDDELVAVVEATIAEEGAEGPKDMGRVMKAVMAKVQGLADGGRVSPLVKTRLVP